MEQLKTEILETENAFAQMAREKGLATAFTHFADENAVINRDNQLYKGIHAIRNYFEEKDFRNVQLIWKPDFVEVTPGGELAYTYGCYEMTALDGNGISHETAGIFHTVWKRQADGNWKYVWD